MKFTVSGADRDTGDAMEFTVDAPDENGAREIAHRKGLLVSAVAPARSSVVVANTDAKRTPRSTPVEHGHISGAPVVNVALPRRGSSLGIASIVLGVLGFFICWIPLVNVVAIVLAGLGLLLGVIGVIVAMSRRGSGMGFPIAGSAICGVGLAVAIGVNMIVMGGIAKAGNALAEAEKRQRATNQTTGPSTAAITNGDSGPVPADKDSATHPSQNTPRGRPLERKPATADTAEPAVSWAPADQPVRQGDVEIQVVSVKVTEIDLVSMGEKTTSKDPLLRIEVRLSNLGDTKKLDYHTWRGRSSFSSDVATLRDNFGNTYKRANFGIGTRIASGTDSGAIYPGKTITDVLVFEEPIGKAEELHLELPAAAFAGTGTIRVKIPESMIQR